MAKRSNNRRQNTPWHLIVLAIANIILLTSLVYFSTNLVGRLVPDPDIQDLVQDTIFAPVLAALSVVVSTMAVHLLGEDTKDNLTRLVKGWAKSKFFLVLIIAAPLSYWGNLQVSDICFNAPKAQNPDGIAVLFDLAPNDNETAQNVNAWPMVLRHEISETLQQEGIELLQVPEFTQVTTAAQAQQLNRCTNAVLTVWGTVYPNSLEINYTHAAKYGFPTGTYLRQTTNEATISPQQGVVSPDTFNAYVESGGDTEYILSAILGMVERDHQRAVELLTNALEHADMQRAIPLGVPTIYSLRGAHLSDLGLKDLALADHNTAVDLSPNSAIPLTFRAKLYWGIGEYDLAWADINQAVLDPKGNAIAYTARGWFHLELAQYYLSGGAVTDHYDLAINDFDQAIELNPTLDAAYSNRGIGYFLKAYAFYSIAGNYNQEWFDQAIRDYDTAISLDGNSELTYQNRGFAHYELGHGSEALSDLTRAIELNPNLSEAYNTRGHVYYELFHNDTLALADYEKYIELTGAQNPIVLQRIDELKARLNR